jgi:hypothetical protein
MGWPRRTCRCCCCPLPINDSAEEGRCVCHCHHCHRCCSNRRMCRCCRCFCCVPHDVAVNMMNTTATDDMVHGLLGHCCHRGWDSECTCMFPTAVVGVITETLQSFPSALTRMLGKTTATTIVTVWVSGGSSGSIGGRFWTRLRS